MIEATGTGAWELNKSEFSGAKFWLEFIVLKNCFGLQELKIQA